MNILNELFPYYTVISTSSFIMTDNNSWRIGNNFSIVLAS